jgi:hypothetical protein
MDRCARIIRAFVWQLITCCPYETYRAGNDSLMCRRAWRWTCQFRTSATLSVSNLGLVIPSDASCMLLAREGLRGHRHGRFPKRSPVFFRGSREQVLAAQPVCGTILSRSHCHSALRTAHSRRDSLSAKSSDYDGRQQSRHTLPTAVRVVLVRLIAPTNDQMAVARGCHCIRVSAALAHTVTKALHIPGPQASRDLRVSRSRS